MRDKPWECWLHRCLCRRGKQVQLQREIYHAYSLCCAHHTFQPRRNLWRCTRTTRKSSRDFHPVPGNGHTVPSTRHPAQRGAVWSPESGRAPKAGCPIPEKVSAKKGEAQKGGAQKSGRLWAPRGGRPNIFALLLLSSAQMSFSLLLSGGRGSRPWLTQSARLGFSGAVTHGTVPGESETWQFPKRASLARCRIGESRKSSSRNSY